MLSRRGLEIKIGNLYKVVLSDPQEDWARANGEKCIVTNFQSSGLMQWVHAMLNDGTEFSVWPNDLEDVLDEST